MYKKIFLSVSALLVFLLLASCDLPTYNVSSGTAPDKILSEFLDMVISGESDDANDLLYNYSWDNTFHEIDETVSPSGALILDYLTESRAYKIKGEPEYTGSHSANVTLEYTTFDIKKFQQSLEEKVVEIIKKKQYYGITFKSPEDTKDIIEDNKTELLKNPRDFYTTREFKIEMINSSGKWRIVLSDEFYKALTGYAL